MLVKAIAISGTTHVIISKTDILEQVGVYKCKYKDNIISFNTIELIKEYIDNVIIENCPFVEKIVYSNNPHSVDL